MKSGTNRCRPTNFWYILTLESNRNSWFLWHFRSTAITRWFWGPNRLIYLGFDSCIESGFILRAHLVNLSLVYQRYNIYYLSYWESKLNLGEFFTHWPRSTNRHDRNPCIIRPVSRFIQFIWQRVLHPKQTLTKTGSNTRERFAETAVTTWNNRKHLKQLKTFETIENFSNNRKHLKQSKTFQTKQQLETTKH